MIDPSRSTNILPRLDFGIEKNKLKNCRKRKCIDTLGCWHSDKRLKIQVRVLYPGVQRKRKKNVSKLETDIPESVLPFFVNHLWNKLNNDR